MSGIYIHIPFCKKACHYCNFHFSTNMSLKSDLVNAISKELANRKAYLNGDKIRTIYFGGGTPSVLSKEELIQIFETIYKNYEIEPSAEVTLEANPDDLDQDKLKVLKDVGINRLSIGVQSFFEEDLKWMNRSHDAQQAKSCVKDAQDIGIDNISIDLIFGNPTSSKAIWQKNLEITNQLDIPHISCYGLTVEPETALEKMIKKGKTVAPKEEDYAEQFVETMSQLSAMGYDHYEISNYAKDDKISEHNTNYWRQENYLGIGPAAHSFNGSSRQWNVNHNPKYIEAIRSENQMFEREELSAKDRYNEFLMTGLRTKWGCSLDRLYETTLSQRKSIIALVESYIHSGDMVQKDKNIILTNQGRLVADHIISSLFVNEL